MKGTFDSLLLLNKLLV